MGTSNPTISELAPNTQLLITCPCGYQRKEWVSSFKMANLGFMKLSQMREILSCGRLKCHGAPDAQVITPETQIPPAYSTPIAVQGRSADRPH